MDETDYMLLSERLLRAHHLKPRPKAANLNLPLLGPGQLRAFSSWLLSVSRVNTLDCLELITLLLTREWPEPDLPALRTLAGDAARTGVCSTVWKQDELAYKCKTCERDPTCAICVPCFRHGNHEGHDYAMIRTGGGCCDCGDVQAWKSNGFCSRHGGACGEDEDPALPMSTELRVSLVEVIAAVSAKVFSECTRFYKAIRRSESCTTRGVTENVCDMSSVSNVVALLMWMGRIVNCGDGIRRVVGIYLSKPAETSWLNSMLRLDGIGRLPAAVQASLHSLYFQLITDLVFKRAFLEMFVENYPRFVHSLVNSKTSFAQNHTEDPENRKNDIMDNFSVQLFTVPALIPVMMRKGGLLDVLINMILHLLEVASMPVLPYIDVEPGKSQFEMLHVMSQGLEAPDNLRTFTNDTLSDFVIGGNSMLRNSSARNCSSTSSIPREASLPNGSLALPEWLFRSDTKDERTSKLKLSSPLMHSRGIFCRNNELNGTNDLNAGMLHRLEIRNDHLHRFTQAARRNAAPSRSDDSPVGNNIQGNVGVSRSESRPGFHFRFPPTGPARSTGSNRRHRLRTTEAGGDSNVVNSQSDLDHGPFNGRLMPPLLHRRTGFITPGTLLARIPRTLNTNHSSMNSASGSASSSTANEFPDDLEAANSVSVDGLREIVRVDELSPLSSTIRNQMSVNSSMSVDDILMQSIHSSYSASADLTEVVSGEGPSRKSMEASTREFNESATLAFLKRDLLKKIREIQAAALEADARDRHARGSDIINALDQRHSLQQEMFERGLDNIDPSLEDKPCVLGNQPFGKFYQMSVLDAKRRSHEAAKGSGNIAHTLRIEWFNSQILETAVWRVIYDLKYVLTHGAIAVHMVHHRPDLFRLYVRILSMMQGMNPITREFGGHVPVEPESWSKAFTLEIEISQMTHFLVVAFCKSPKDGIHTNSDPTASDKQLTAQQSRSRCISIARQCLNEWIDREKGLESMSVHFGEEFSVAHSISVHFPLHRLLSVLAYQSHRLDGLSPSCALSGSRSGTTPEEAMDLICHPLRIQVFLAQVRAGMWNRNGRSVIGQALLYRSIICAEWFVDMDLFLQQTCAIIAGEDRFVHETLNAFQISSFSNLLRVNDARRSIGMGRKLDDLDNFRLISTIPVSKSDVHSVAQIFKTNNCEEGNRELEITWMQTSLGEDAYFGTSFSNLALGEYVPSIVEDLFTYLVHVTTERARCGFDDRLCLRRKLIHALAWQDQTHSELLRASPRRSQQPSADDITDPAPLGTEKADALVSTMVDETLKDIADFEQPHGMQQGRYRLKDRTWEEFDRFSPQLSVRHRSTAEERYSAACRRLDIKPLPFQSTSVSDLPIYAEYEGLKMIAVYLCSQKSESLASLLLEKCLPGEGCLRALEGSLPGALYFACMAVEFAKPVHDPDDDSSSAANVYNSWLSNQIVASSKSPRNCLDVIGDMYCLSGDSLGAPFGEVRYGLERILREAHARANRTLKRKLTAKVPSLFGQSSSVVPGGTDPDKDALLEATKRRKMIMEMKKKMQAAAMEQMRASQERFEKLIDSSVEESDSDGQETFEKKNDFIDSSRKTRTKMCQDFPKKHVHLLESQTCALCREEASKRGGAMGLVGFLQTTKIPDILQTRCEPERRRALAAAESENNAETASDPLGRSEFMLNVENQVAQVVENEHALEDGEWGNFFVAGNRMEMTAMVGAIIRNTGQDPGNAEANAVEVENVSNGGADEAGVAPNEIDIMEVVVASSTNDEFSQDSREDTVSAANPHSSEEEEIIRKFLRWDSLRQGSDDAKGVHFGFCGHSVHTKCFERYFQSLVDSQRQNGRFEGDTLVLLERGEFLCPFCRRIANFLLPISETEVEIPVWKTLQGLSTTEREQQFSWWLKKVDSVLTARNNDDGNVNTPNRSRNIVESESESGGEIRRGLEIVAQFLSRDQQPSTNTDAHDVAYLGRHELEVLSRLGDWLEMPSYGSPAYWAHRGNVLLERNVAKCINVLMLSVITTFVCAEIGSRSGYWDGSTSESKRRTMGLLIREARMQARAHPRLARYHLNLLWKTVHKAGIDSLWDVDAFSAFVLLVLLWEGDLELEDMHGILRISYELALKQAVDLGKSCNDDRACENSEIDVLLFLRRASIFLSCFLEFEIAITNYQDNQDSKDTENELDTLLTELALTSGDDYAMELSSIRSLPKSVLAKSGRISIRKPFRPTRIGLIVLPPQFQDLLEWLDGRSCDICGEQPDKPALCLACGDLFCHTSSRLRKPCVGDKGDHSQKCGGGVGVFLVLKMTSVIVSRDRRRSRWGSPYLDEHGEEDHELHRGKPLFLSKERYESLEKLWLSHGFDHDFRILNSSQLPRLM